MLSVIEIELWLSAVVVTKDTVGAVLSNVTLPLPLVTAVPAFPAESLNAILYATEPVVSLDSVVYTAVQVFSDVFTYVKDVSVIAAPPERKVTTGVDIVSLAVNESVTLSPTAASVDVELFDAILTLLNVGTVVSLDEWVFEIVVENPRVVSSLAV
jgi:hypothetical protein